VATDASGIKGIGGIYRKQFFSERVLARHHKKYINWKEMFVILHAFVLWHKEWAGGRISRIGVITATRTSGPPTHN